jgi:branched-chain amino acid transport system permease protein
MFQQQLVNGIVLGSIYALIALGYTMVYGIVELINFAHGEIYMIGAYSAVIFLALLTAIHVNPPVFFLVLLLFPFAMILTAMYGATMERVAYRPLRGAPRLSLIISALGMSLFFQNYVMIAQGARDKVFPQDVAKEISLMISGIFQNILPAESLTSTGFYLFGAQFSYVDFLTFISSITLMVVLQLFIKRTKIGKAMRATAQDIGMSKLVGINVNRIIRITFIIGSALAAAAGVMIAANLKFGRVHYFMGWIIGLKAFTAAVLGGIGNIPGAMLGGFLLGIIESLAAGFISSEYKDAYAFIILIVVLIIKPTGLLGERVPEKM